MNHNAPSGPAVMFRGSLPPVGTEYGVIIPVAAHPAGRFTDVQTLPIAFSPVNHRFPSEPVTMPLAAPIAPGPGNSSMAPATVIRPICPSNSVNHKAPSGPAVMLWGKLDVEYS